LALIGSIIDGLLSAGARGAGMVGPPHRSRSPGPLSPPNWQHVNPYGSFGLKMQERLALEQMARSASANLPIFQPKVKPIFLLATLQL
jgi:hypothetical protein